MIRLIFCDGGKIGDYAPRKIYTHEFANIHHTLAQQTAGQSLQIAQGLD